MRSVHRHLRATVACALLSLVACDATDDASDAAVSSDAAVGSTPDAAPLDATDVREEAPLLAPIDDVTLDEEQALALPLRAHAGARVFLEGAPAGSVWSEPTRTLRFTPDFIQGGRTYTVTAHAASSDACASETFTITVRDTIAPTPPEIVRETGNGMLRFIRVALTTDEYLDPPGLAGRTFEAVLTVPRAASAEHPMPVRIGLHGSGGSAANVGANGLFGIGPSEPFVTWWSGQSERLPEEPTDGRVLDYSQRRILFLLDWLDQHFPGVDRDAVVASGRSMGGVGALWLAARHGRHIASVDARLAMTAARLMGSGQRGSLGRHWGSEDAALLAEDDLVVWDSYDVMRALRDSPDARDVFYLVDNAKNDTLTTFRHWIVPSPATGETFVAALQRLRVGHLLGWDQRGHSTGRRFWQALDKSSVVRRDRSFPAFSRSSADDDAGAVLEDGTMSGDTHGVINRYLEWDSDAIEDAYDHYALPLRLDIEAVEPRDDGRPPEGDGYAGPLPIVADVTIRRAQRFLALPGERIRYHYEGPGGAHAGEVVADEAGLITVAELAFDGEERWLRLERTEPRCWPE